MRYLKKLAAAPVSLLLISAGCYHNSHMAEEWSGRDWPHMMYYGAGGWIMWVVLIILVAIIAYLAWAMSKGRTALPRGEESALDILKKRYARGELTREQFEQMKKELEE